MEFTEANELPEALGDSAFDFVTQYRYTSLTLQFKHVVMSPAVDSNYWLTL